MIVVSENTKRNYYNAANYKLEESYAAFEILSSTLYSNKIGAVVRELLSNAIDSHNRSRKKDIPVEIGVEQRTDGDIFYVEDFGLGLTEDEATYLFSTYFATTKGDENESIGGFGLGCKSPFAYTDSFKVIATKAGEVNTFLASREPGDLPKFFLDKKEFVNKSNGLRIEVPIKAHDARFFCAEILRHVKFFRPVPNTQLINDFIAYDDSEDVNKILSMINQQGFACLNTSYYNEYRNKIGVLIGGIYYPVNIIDDNYDYIKSVACTVIIDAPIGSVSVSASRESISYDKKTEEYLRAKILEIKRFISNDIARISNIESLFKRSDKYIEKYLSNTSVYRETMVHNIDSTVSAEFPNGKYVAYTYSDQNNFVKNKIIIDTRNLANTVSYLVKAIRNYIVVTLDYSDSHNITRNKSRIIKLYATNLNKNILVIDRRAAPNFILDNMINDPEYISVMDFSEVVRTVEEFDTKNIVSIKKTYKITPKNIVSNLDTGTSISLDNYNHEETCFYLASKNDDFGYSVFSQAENYAKMYNVNPKLFIRTSSSYSKRIENAGFRLIDMRTKDNVFYTIDIQVMRFFASHFANKEDYVRFVIYCYLISSIRDYFRWKRYNINQFSTIGKIDIVNFYMSNMDISACAEGYDSKVVEDLEYLYDEEYIKSIDEDSYLRHKIGMFIVNTDNYISDFICDNIHRIQTEYPLLKLISGNSEKDANVQLIDVINEKYINAKL